jgi:hypothetical protein
MPRGGKRPGAGRPKGSVSKRTLSKVKLPEATQHRVPAVVAEELPLDVLLAAMRDKNLPIEIRLAAAKVAAPYFHGRISTGPQRTSYEMTESELEEAIRREKEAALRIHLGHRHFRTIER